MLSARRVLNNPWRLHYRVINKFTIPKFARFSSSTAAVTDQPLEEQDSRFNDKSKFVNPKTGEWKRWSNWHYNTELTALIGRLGFKELPSLKEALTLRLPDTVPLKGQDNARLNILGATVLQHYVTEYIYCTYRNLPGEGLRSLVRGLIKHEQMCRLAEHLGVVDLIRTSFKLYDPLQVNLISKAMSAVIGAVYMDQGTLAARKFIHEIVISQLASKDPEELIRFHHPKLMLTHLLKKGGLPEPVAKLVRESGRMTHFPTFVVAVYSGSVQLAEGAGTSLKRAENEALEAALRKHFQNEMKQGPLPSDIEDFKRENDINLFWSELKNEETADQCRVETEV